MATFACQMKCSFLQARNRSSKYQTKIYSNYKQKWNINSHATCGQFKATTTKTDQVSIKPKYIKLQTKISQHTVVKFRSAPDCTSNCAISKFPLSQHMWSAVSFT